MLGKVALLAGAGAACVLLIPEARTRVTRLLRGGDTSPAGTSGGTGQAGSRPRLLQVPRRLGSAKGSTVPPLVDRRPQGSTDEQSVDEATGARLLPDASPVEIARAVSEEQAQG